MFAVFATYPSGAKILVGYAHQQVDVDGLISDCLKVNGAESIEASGIHLDVEPV